MRGPPLRSRGAFGCAAHEQELVGIIFCILLLVGVLVLLNVYPQYAVIAIYYLAEIVALAANSLGCSTADECYTILIIYFIYFICLHWNILRNTSTQPNCWSSSY